MFSILKSDQYSIDFRKNIEIEKLINTEWLDFLEKQPYQYKNMTIKKLGQFFIVEQKSKYVLNEKISNEIKSKYYKYIFDRQNKDKIFIQDIDELMKCVYLDIYVILEMILVKMKNNENYSDFKNLLDKELIKEIQIKRLNKNEERENGNEKFQRSTLLEKNGLAVEFTKNKNFLINHKITNLLKYLNAEVVEIPEGYDKDKLENALDYIVNVLNQFDIKKRNFKLRFKKIKLYKKNGMFFKNANTIIIDPRSVYSFKHELGHFIYENGINFTYNGKRINKESMNKIIQKCKKENKIPNKEEIHKLEDYEFDSEIFAYWFENL